MGDDEYAARGYSGVMWCEMGEENFASNSTLLPLKVPHPTTTWTEVRIKKCLLIQPDATSQHWGQATHRKKPGARAVDSREKSGGVSFPTHFSLHTVHPRFFSRIKLPPLTTRVLTQESIYCTTRKVPFVSWKASFFPALRVWESMAEESQSFSLCRFCCSLRMDLFSHATSFHRTASVTTTRFESQ